MGHGSGQPSQMPGASRQLVDWHFLQDFKQCTNVTEICKGWDGDVTNWAAESDMESSEGADKILEGIDFKVVDGSPRIVAIKFIPSKGKQNQLSGTLPQSLGTLEELCSFELSGCTNMVGEIPKSVGGLSKLRKFVVRKT